MCLVSVRRAEVKHSAVAAAPCQQVSMVLPFSRRRHACASSIAQQIVRGKEFNNDDFTLKFQVTSIRRVLPGDINCMDENEEDQPLEDF